MNIHLERVMLRLTASGKGSRREVRVSVFDPPEASVAAWSLVLTSGQAAVVAAVLEAKAEE